MTREERRRAAGRAADADTTYVVRQMLDRADRGYHQCQHGWHHVRRFCAMLAVCRHIPLGDLDDEIVRAIGPVRYRTLTEICRKLVGRDDAANSAVRAIIEERMDALTAAGAIHEEYGDRSRVAFGVLTPERRAEVASRAAAAQARRAMTAAVRSRADAVERALAEIGIPASAAVIRFDPPEVEITCSLEGAERLARPSLAWLVEDVTAEEEPEPCGW
jgi:hypothetical protein